MMKSWHRPGQKVVCKLKGNVLFSDRRLKIPEVGKIYTISGVHLFGPYIVFTLEGFPEDEAHDSQLFEPVFPVSEEKLQRLRVKPPSKVKEDA